MKKLLLLAFMSLGIVSATNAQDSFQSETYPAFTPLRSVNDGEYHPKNVFKTNLLGIVFKNYSLTYERVLNKHFSASLELRSMPSTSIPFINVLAKQSNDLISDNLKAMKLSGFGIMPEIRFYPLKGYGRGFYLGAFYKNISYKADNFVFKYDSEGQTQSINIEGKLSTNTFGLEIGKQWMIGKHFVLDWIILGVQYGTAKASFDGQSTQAMTPDQQESLRDGLNSIDVPFVKTEKDVNVGSRSAHLGITSPWIGLRSGFSIGFCF